MLSTKHISIESSAMQPNKSFEKDAAKTRRPSTQTLCCKSKGDAMRNLLVIVTVSVVLLGCAKFHRAEMAERARTELLGLSKKELLTCAGVPVRSQQVDDMEFLTYAGGSDSVGYFGGGVGSSGGGGVIALNKRYCEVTFVLRNGIVEKVNYAGRTGGLLTKGEQCGFVVENCLPSR
jgi:hypothetical protein